MVEILSYMTYMKITKRRKPKERERGEKEEIKLTLPKNYVKKLYRCEVYSGTKYIQNGSIALSLKGV